MKLPALLSALTATALIAADEQPIETGKVSWQRDLETALTESKSSGKPVFVLFQEVPGCSGCKQFGRDVLSHPTIVAAIEHEFVPLLVHNNQKGKDAEVLKRFKEPAWNYQVVRFLDADAKDLIPRKDRVWTTGPLVDRMTSALKKAKRPIPAYLSLLASEHSKNLRKVAFQMGCFWTGEMKLGQIAGVVTTEAGFINRREVSLVEYDPSIIKLDQLMDAAAKVKCARVVYLSDEELAGLPETRLKTARLADYRAAPDRDQKKQLGGTPMEKIELTPAQATKVNAWIRSDAQKAASFLPPGLR